MRSFFSSSKPSFAAALLLTFVVALLPSDWMRWTNGVWNAVDVLVAPFGQAATQLRVWIRGEPTVRVPPGTDVHERLVQLEEEAATALMLHAREKLRVKQLEARLAELEGVRRADPDANTRLIAADSNTRRSARVRRSRRSRSLASHTSIRAAAVSGLRGRKKTSWTTCRW